MASFHGKIFPEMCVSKSQFYTPSIRVSKHNFPGLLVNLPPLTDPKVAKGNLATEGHKSPPLCQSGTEVKNCAPFGFGFDTFYGFVG
ncbi:hypothetical protein CEXT_403991 [Caerostris extrusa]|uniref:Uncharacterized protein n=1 Tax=Caerostris extrusa TaxID=172846 RepID=A0AAV4RPE9_CAEEX|nr:hypothetical protein CEXT_403991 [Caerostris extrusa]